MKTVHSFSTTGTEPNLWLVRVERQGVRGPGVLALMPGTEVVLTVCSGEDDAKAYIATERAAGPCKVWIRYLGDVNMWVEQEA